MSEIKILSIRQPWASLIANGHKNIENRKTLKNFRGRFWIHAGKQVDKVAMDQMRSVLHKSWTKLPDFKTGGIVGQAEIVDCVQESNSKWFEPGCNGFVIIKAHPVPFIPLKGQLGFFNVPDYLCERCLGVMIGDDAGYCDKCDFQNGGE